MFCRMLGFDGTSSSDYVDEVRPREGTWPTWITLRDSKCKGSERTIEECHETGLWKHESICGHDYDVVLTCQVCCCNMRSFKLMFRTGMGGESALWRITSPSR